MVRNSLRSFFFLLKSQIVDNAKVFDTVTSSIFRVKNAKERGIRFLRNVGNHLRTLHGVSTHKNSLNYYTPISPTLSRKVNLNTLNFCNKRNMSAVLTDPDKQEVGEGGRHKGKSIYLLHVSTSTLPQPSRPTASLILHFKILRPHS
jgi:hypothetical protein